MLVNNRIDHTIDPKNPLRPSTVGVYEKNGVICGRERCFLYYIPEDVRSSVEGIFIFGDGTTTARELYEKSNWVELADSDEYKEKFIVFFLEPTADGWGLETPAPDLAYVRWVWEESRKRDQMCVHEAKYYYIGYGTGGTMAQMAAMDDSAEIAGVASLGAPDVSEKFIRENGEASCVHLGNYEDPTGKYGHHKKDFTVPSWIVSDAPVEEAAESAAARYWRACAETSPTPHLLRPDVLEYVRETPAPWTVNQDRECFRVWISHIPDAKADYGRRMNRRLLSEFLRRVRRWTGEPGGDLRMAFDPVRDLGCEYHYEEIGGWMREYYVYLPEAVKAAPQKPVPLVFAIHGYSCSGEIYAGNSDWHKVADRNGFIVVFPSAVNGYLRTDNPDNPAVGENDTELPAWNLLDLCPVAPDELTFFEEMLRRVSAAHAVDSSRVFVTGHSLGSLMTQYLGLARPELFTAIAPCSGVLFLNAYEKFMKKECVVNRKQAVLPVWMFAGEEEQWLLDNMPTPDNATGISIDTWRRLNGQPNPDDHAYESYRTDKGRFRDYVFPDAQGRPILRYTWVKELPHATMTEMSFRIWDEFFSKLSRAEDGSVIMER
ncbi:MAG: PHB depolymerase family esterase [Dysosmobacter sp.]|nr:PHB depolymerase family esterase [Dysosmobacter sp.]